MEQKKITYYNPKEERFNVISHAFGLVLSVIALVLLVVFASLEGSVWHVVSFSIYGASLIVLYAASTFYHNSKTPKLRYRLNIFDHASIYILIAGTYTPFTLVVLDGWVGWTIFGVSWGLAFTGVILKLFFIGKYDKISTIAYVLMGWLIVFAIKPLVQNLPIEGLFWLLGGGISYTVGAILYSIKSIKYNHAIFHIFVLLGSFCHFMVIFFYVLPIKK
ncbi:MULTISPECIES: PAQR family membrane homeostasis protein TrhA [Flavobacteriaceae]|uniref:Hemolysin III family protein n=2 Tax=Flavobacteriaceae TaxID=49546 RepID=A0A4Y8ATQ9_9FLAO|nr:MULTISPECIES: hemolysin III family protein [Flavobacteriaceae]TEW74066.1 hemolysin III family protein [Gramella jeungdoensis]GGK39972.1 hemolysin D [Lutibacter litoralis]